MDALLQFLQTFFNDLIPFVIIGPDEGGVRVRTIPFVTWFHRFWPKLPKTGQFITDLTPGMYFKLPFGELTEIDDISIIGTKRTNADIDNVTVRTADNKTVLISLALKYEIYHPRRALLETEDPTDSTIADVMSIVTAWANVQQNSDITVASLIEANFEPMRKAALRWGVKLLEVGVNSIADHKVYRIIMD